MAGVCRSFSTSWGEHRSPAEQPSNRPILSAYGEPKIPPTKKARMAPAIRAFLSYSPAFMDSTMSIFFIFRPITRLTRKEKNMVMAAASR